MVAQLSALGWRDAPQRFGGATFHHRPTVCHQLRLITFHSS